MPGVKWVASPLEPYDVQKREEPFPNAGRRGKGFDLKADRITPPTLIYNPLQLIISTLEIHFLFFLNEFREGTYTPLRGVSYTRILQGKGGIFMAQLPLHRCDIAGFLHDEHPHAVPNMRGRLRKETVEIIDIP